MIDEINFVGRWVVFTLPTYLLARSRFDIHIAGEADLNVEFACGGGDCAGNMMLVSWSLLIHSCRVRRHNYGNKDRYYIAATTCWSRSNIDERSQPPLCTIAVTTTADKRQRSFQDGQTLTATMEIICHFNRADLARQEPSIRTPGRLQFF